VRCHCCQAKKFLGWLPDPLAESLSRLDTGMVTAFVMDQATVAGSVWSAKTLVTALRSLLRFMHVDGVVRAIMGRACRNASLPRMGAHRLRHSLATEVRRAGAGSVPWGSS